MSRPTTSGRPVTARPVSAALRGAPGTASRLLSTASLQRPGTRTGVATGIGFTTPVSPPALDLKCWLQTDIVILFSYVILQNVNQGCSASSLKFYNVLSPMSDVRLCNPVHLACFLVPDLYVMGFIVLQIRCRTTVFRKHGPKVRLFKCDPCTFPMNFVYGCFKKWWTWDCRI